MSNLRPTPISQTAETSVAQSTPHSPVDFHAFEVPAPPLAERVYGLSTLWSEAKFSFAFFDRVPELDWDEAYKEYIPRVAASETMYKYYRELQSFIALLADGHTGVYMPTSVKIDVVALRIEVIDGNYFIRHSQVSLVDRIPVGSEIVAVRGVDVNRYVDSEVAPYIAQSSPQAREQFKGLHLLSAPFGEEVPFTIVTPDGLRRDVSATTGRFYGTCSEYTPALPLQKLKVEWPADGIAQVPLATFVDSSIPEQFKSLVPELETARAIILDLRYNTGGMTDIASAVLAHFADRDLQGSRWTTRQHRAAHRVWGTYGCEDYQDFGQLNAWTEPCNHPTIRIETASRLAGKPLAILTSTSTASAAEDFLIYADPLEYTTRIGQPTFGSTGQPLPIDLPGGGTARICTKRDTWPDGTDFVGIGIKPHIPVPITVKDICIEFDHTLAVAIDHLKEQLSSTPSHHD